MFSNGPTAFAISCCFFFFATHFSMLWNQCCFKQRHVHLDVLTTSVIGGAHPCLKLDTTKVSLLYRGEKT